MVFKGKDTRAERRYSFRMSIECAYDAEDCELAKKGPWKTFTTDISHSGLGFYSECSAREGQTVKIFLKNVYKDPILAEVKWCRRYMDNLFKIGVQYIGPAPMNFSLQT
jgi:c-di-GMP-binding flagellar brake protein YcgR